MITVPKRWAAAGAALLVLAGTAATATLSFLAANASAADHDRKDALAAAQTRIPALLTYNYRTLGDDLARSKEQTVGAFHDDYAKLLDEVVSPAATAKKISTTATLSGAGVVASKGSRVTVLVFLTQTTTAPTASPSVTASRVEVTMKQSGDTWKIAGLAPR